MLNLKIIMSKIFEYTLLNFQNYENKIMSINHLVTTSFGNDSISLMILWCYLLSSKPVTSEKKRLSFLWCNHLWKIKDFFILRHLFQLSFIFYKRFFYSISLNKYFNEKNARHYRYFIFTRIAYYSNSFFIITAHTNSDKIETFFINLFNGTGKIGLQNIKEFQIYLNNECSQKFY